MLYVFICEDNDNHRRQIEGIVNNYILMEDLNMKLIISSPSPYDILEYISKNSISGLYFLDVNLEQDLNGIMLAENIRKYDPRGFIVFITMHEEMLPLIFKYKVEALDFISKEDFHISNYICQCISNAYTKYTTKTSELQNNFIFKMNNNIISLEQDKIVYFESSVNTPHKIILYATDTIYNFYGNMNEISNDLNKNFYRCHKSYIVNIKRIIKIDKEKRILYMDNKATCSISVRKMHKLINLMQ